jgi:hypothetical protein
LTPAEVRRSLLGSGRLYALETIFIVARAHRVGSHAVDRVAVPADGPTPPGWRPTRGWERPMGAGIGAGAGRTAAGTADTSPHQSWRGRRRAGASVGGRHRSWWRRHRGWRPVQPWLARGRRAPRRRLACPIVLTVKSPGGIPMMIPPVFRHHTN